MDIQENLEIIEAQYDNTVDFEPMRCGPHEDDWR